MGFDEEIETIGRLFRVDDEVIYKQMQGSLAVRVILGVDVRRVAFEHEEHDGGAGVVGGYVERGAFLRELMKVRG